jgi:predicted DNA-binding transcriptional regulator YafY
MQNGTILRIYNLCSEFNVNEKTIKRDIELLRSMGEEIVYDRGRRGYKLLFSMF